MANTSLGIPLTPDTVKISKLAAADRAIANALDQILSGEFTPEFLDKLTEAAQQVIDAADLLTTTSDLVPVRDTAPDRVFAWSDHQGKIPMYLDDSGRLNLLRDPVLPPGSLPLEALSPASGLIPLTPDTGYRYGIGDETGKLSAAVDLDGAFHVFRGVGAIGAIRSLLLCLGDSLTYGYSNGAAWPAQDAYPAKLQEQRPDIQVAKEAFPGQSIDEIRLNVGAMPLLLSVTGSSIPSSGSVTVTTKQLIGWGGIATVSIGGTLAGVPGVFQRTPSGDMTFTRTHDGAAAPVTKATRLIVDTPDYTNHTVIFWPGRNDVNSQVTGASDSVVEHVVSSTVEFVEWLAPRCKSVIVVGTTNRVDEVQGTQGYDQCVTIGERFAQLLPGKYFNMRDYLNHQAIHDAGITPTPADLANMEADAPPPSIWDNGSHYLPIIAPLVATQLRTRAEAKGLI